VLCVKHVSPMYKTSIRGSHASPLPPLPPAIGNSRNVSLFYTRDYNMSPGRPVLQAPVQGGFLCLRPNQWAYDTLWAVVKKGDFGKGSGWGGSHIGNFWGGMTIQGLVPYFVVKVAPLGFAEEIDRCVYNQMVWHAHTSALRHDAFTHHCRRTADNIQCRLSQISSGSRGAPLLTPCYFPT